MNDLDHDDASLLPRELVWEGAHVSELALTAIADGQDAIVHPAARAHAESCDFCAGRMARSALLSAAVGLAVAETAPLRTGPAGDRAVARGPVTSPWKALSLGVAVAVLAALPSLPQLMGNLASLLAFGRTMSSHGLPLLVRGGVALATSDEVARMLSIATVVSAALLVMMGCAIAGVRSRAGAETSERSMS